MIAPRGQRPHRPRSGSSNGSARVLTVMWAAATVVGMFASAALGVYLVAAVAADRGPAVPVDILVTGLVIGGGTKPLHDLIARIERSKQSAGAPDLG